MGFADPGPRPPVSLFRSLEAVAGASGDGVVDWAAVAEAAKALTDAGHLGLGPDERRAYAVDVRDAHHRVEACSGLSFELPSSIEVQNRHHWIDVNVETFRRLLAPLADEPSVLPGLARRLNTASTAAALAFLASHVLGQYDPLLLAEADDHELYFVHPNIRHVASELDVDEDRFRRWIAFHEVTHAAEFGAAPWVRELLETHVEALVDAAGDGRLDRGSFAELQTVMTAIEGYAEFVMDRAFDREAADLREALEARRSRRGPLAVVMGRLLGLDLKRRQYERGRAFFEAVAEAGGDPAAVWGSPSTLPSAGELDAPERWLDRVGA